MGHYTCTSTLLLHPLYRYFLSNESCLLALCVVVVYATGGSEGVSLFQFIENVATQIPTKWRGVGLALGLRQSQIDAIEEKGFTDPLNCFLDVFSFWQQQSTTQQPVSWTTLVTVLRSQSVGEEALADFLQQRFVGNECNNFSR